MQKIKMTKEYDKFKFIKGNREISTPYVSELCQSIRFLNLTEFRPILVNDKMEIIDGQHSFEACRELNYPVYYIVGKGLNIEAVRLLNWNVSKWSGMDFLNMYARKGLKNYVVLNEFMERWNFPLWTSFCLLSGYETVGGGGGRGRTGSGKRAFQEGGFIIKTKARADKIAEQCCDFATHTTNYRTRTFVIACAKLFVVPVYDHKRMKQQLTVYKKSIPHLDNWRAYVKCLSDIYDYRRKDTVKIRTYVKM